jgi:hypothetical protein
MSTDIRELHPVDLPRPLIYVTAMTCGVLAAMAMQIALSRGGFDFSGVWDSLFSTTPKLRSASTWWLMVGSAFVVSGAVAAALSSLPRPWFHFPRLRWLLAGAVLFGLAEIGHSSTTTTHDIRAQVALSLLALGAAALMALFGAFFAVRR